MKTDQLKQPAPTDAEAEAARVAKALKAEIERTHRARIACFV